MNHHRTAVLHQESERRLAHFLAEQANTTGSMLTAELVRRFVMEQPQGAMVVVLDDTKQLLTVAKRGFLSPDGHVNADVWSVHIKLSSNGGISFGVKASWDAAFGRMSFR